MARLLPVLLAVGVVAGGFVAWREFGGGRAPDDVPSGEPTPQDPRSEAPTAVPARGGDPAVDAPVPEIEAVARPGEVLPPIRVGERGRVARYRPEVFRQGMELPGDVFLRGLVEARDVWVRWDQASTRERFLTLQIPVPGMQVLESGEAIVFLQPMPDLFRHLGFSARLDGSVLRIGAEGVYPPDPPPPDAPQPTPPGAGADEPK
ncbi:MAG: hypothetical protein JNM10_04670 [Planctomycetia bacterium]|nr:hypothetical protein [Planctomycetia bacterium]